MHQNQQNQHSDDATIQKDDNHYINNIRADREGMPPNHLDQMPFQVVGINRRQEGRVADAIKTLHCNITENQPPLPPDMDTNNFYERNDRQVNQTVNMLENMAFSKPQKEAQENNNESPQPRGRLRFDSIYEASRSTKNNQQQLRKNSYAQYETSAKYQDFDYSHEEHMNNPFTRNLMDRLGPEFNPSNLINKNQKMFHNLSMLNGFAFCGEDEAYEHTYLDRIKIDKNYIHDNFNDKPPHIDKLFENEEEYLDNDGKIQSKLTSKKVESLYSGGTLDPARLLSQSAKNQSNQDRRKLKRQRISSGSQSSNDLHKSSGLDKSKDLMQKIQIVAAEYDKKPQFLNFLVKNTQQFQSKVDKALQKSVKQSEDKIGSSQIIDFALKFILNLFDEVKIHNLANEKSNESCALSNISIDLQESKDVPKLDQSSVGSEYRVRKQILALNNDTKSLMANCNQSLNYANQSETIEAIVSTQTNSKGPKPLSMKLNITEALNQLPDNKGSKVDIITLIQSNIGIQPNSQIFAIQIGQALSKNFRALGNTYKLLLKNVISNDIELQSDSFRDMVSKTLSQMQNQEGTIEEILCKMILVFGKDKICEQTNQTILSFDEHENPSTVKNIKQKIQKIMSRHKDLIYGIQPVQYTFKIEAKKDIIMDQK